MRAIRYEIIRDWPVSGLVGKPVADKPLKVATMMNDEAFLATGCELIHNQTVFLEDQFSDWQWKEGQLYYYSRVCEVGDVLLVYEMESNPRGAV
jgi:hypothetical protein